MKIKIALILIFLSVHLGFSQKIIEEPQYETNSLPGRISKIEILEDATVLSFHIHVRAGSWISVPKESCIITDLNDEKLLVQKAEGIEIGKRLTIDSTGVKNYKLFFPAISNQVGKIDFLESNKGGNWYVHDLVIDEAKYGSILPRELKGNWLKTDGSNTWEYGFYNDYAIINKQIWNYTSVKGKKRKFEIILENGDETKIVYAKLNKNKTIDFGESKRRLSNYSLKRTENKKFKLENNEPFVESTIFKIDTATYSGILKGFGHRSKQKTGIISVTNIFTGNQDSYLVKIKSDGSFSVKFPLYYPQKVYVKLPGFNGGVFFEPGKETWQLINSAKRNDVFFAGDLAELNSGLVSLQHVFNRRGYYKIQKRVKDFSLLEYKAALEKIHTKEVAKYDRISKNRFISEKLNQIMRLELDYGYYSQILGYDMYSRNRNERKIDSAYIGFLTPEIRNNKLAVLAESYYSFINRLRFCEPFDFNKDLSITHPQGVELAAMLKNKGVVLSADEQELINEQIKFNKDNAVSLQKQKDFNIENQALLDSFNKKFGGLYMKLSKEERKTLFISEGLNIDAILKFSKHLDIAFTDEEISIQKARKNILTKKEKQAFKDFDTAERKKKYQALSKSHEEEIKEYTQEEFQKKRLQNAVELFNNETSWFSDILIMQLVSGPIVEQLSPLTNKEIDTVSKYLGTPFVIEYLTIENNRALAKIEANKSATGYVLNETSNKESYEIYDAIMEKYKGKVVFIDFWATWCGPCRTGMKKMEPLKEQLKEEDVVFVYITNPSSPEKTYNNMIPGIKGEHYRISNDEWNYLKIKFNITGIPHYTLVDKEGTVVKEKIKFWSSNEVFVKMIKDCL